MNDRTNPIRTARLAAGLTQIELARRLGWTQGAYSQFETGLPDCHSFARYRRVARAIGCPVVDLLPAE